MKPKILYVIDNLEFGGGERGFLQLIKALHKDYAISVVAHEGGVFCKELKAIGVKLLSLKMNRQVSIKRLLALHQIIKEGCFDIVHGEGSRAEFYGRIASKLAGKGYYVSTVQAPVNKFEVGKVKKTIYILLDFITDRFVDKFIVVSDELQQLMVENHRLKSTKVIKIHNGIELDKISPESGNSDVKRNFGISPDSLLVGAAGRLVWAKGFSYLIDAFKTVKTKFPNSTLLVAGDGPLKSDLVKAAEQHRLAKSIIFPGFINDIPALIKSFDVFVIPSLSEGLPMVILEGMAMAKPMVATSLPGILEQLEDQKTGLIVPPQDSVALGTAIVELLGDREKAKNLGQNARAFVEKHFSIEKMITETEQVYRAALSC